MRLPQGQLRSARCDNKHDQSWRWNAFRIAAINAGSHTNPTLAGDTIYAWSEVKEKAEVARRDDVGALRLRTVAVKNATPAAFPDKAADGKADPSVVLDLDYWVLMPR